MKEITLKMDIHEAIDLRFALDHVPWTGDEHVDAVISTALTVLNEQIDQYNRELP